MVFVSLAFAMVCLRIKDVRSPREGGAYNYEAGALAQHFLNALPQTALFRASPLLQGAASRFRPRHPVSLVN